MSFFTWVGIIVIGIAGLVWFAGTIVSSAIVWMGLWADMKHFIESRRDKKPGVK